VDLLSPTPLIIKKSHARPPEEENEKKVRVAGVLWGKMSDVTHFNVDA
jgi:hypothetical protein